MTVRPRRSSSEEAELLRIIPVDGWMTTPVLAVWKQHPLLTGKPRTRTIVV